ncbi:multidrug efflux pump [Roseivirga ehrenbergii]|uniref:Acriflavin resistance protein n=1 Tax=Roseivirga ehrenbergii (strain DSM 102268 / JCM 13514 / KCTC 12282 / NCIMB 14502 / KMM 6017) TaxID=279360 RepID=A0A150XQY5_ROSEK|nr:efflux RND transporter permease subunit [Roseivirga ehrenbergii]KYG81055.1 acriflavin resistance protein [Roseivirga ehrenbergii]TCL00925.1 multidrug efflux pump [Roseivirga ehrenbergii]
MSSLSTISIKRPVLAMVMNIIIVIFGVIGFSYLGVREFPSVDPPVISVSTSYAGANAQIIEAQITEPIEEALNSIAGIKTLTSTSRDGGSSISAEFDLGVDLEAATNDVRDKVAGVVRRLPPDVEPPTVRKADADASPIIFLNISSKERNLLDLTLLAENIFKERVQTIQGISSVQVWGSKRYSMRLWMDPDKLAAYQLTPLDVQNAVGRDNVELPSGAVEGNSTEIAVRTIGRINSPEEFNNLIVKEEGGTIVRFRDIGRAELAPENDRTILKRNGVPMVGIAVVTQPGSNSIEIADNFYERIELIKKDLPADIELGIGFDNTEYIRESISEVQQTIIVAFALVVVIIFLFLRDWRTTLIPVLTIPISLIGAFFVMYIFGFSINVLTLLGIVLAIGLVVDDTIVVLENIYSKIEGGMEPEEAGIKGTNEIFFAVISTTVALVAVFMPVIFLQGLTGRLFREFGLVVAGAVVISSFVALTLTPMMSSKLLRKSEKKNWFYRKTEPFFVSLNRAYNNSLDGFMNMRWMAFVIILLSAGMIVFFLSGNRIPEEIAPLEDRSSLSANATGPEGATFEYMDRYVDSIISAVDKHIPEKEALITITSPGFGNSSMNSARITIMLKDPSERERSQQQIMDDFTPILAQYTEARTSLSQPATIGGRRSSGFPVQYVIQAPNLEKLKEVLPEFMAKAQDSPEFTFVNLNLKFTKPEITIEIDREKARTLGISVRDVAQTLQLGLAGQRFGFFILDGKQYQIIGQVDRDNRNDPLDLKALYVRSSDGRLIQLDNLVSLEENSSPPQLYRFNRFAAATISASLAPKVTTGQGIDVMDAIAKEVLDESFTTDLAGTSREFRDSADSLYFAFGFALILIYLVLSAQFESFVDPLIIMFTVPLALAGALLVIWRYEESLNIFSQIGIIMLVGLVSKNGILIVEFANQRKADGLSVRDAVLDAAKSRFRPILMTSLSTILGILPIALALGAGAESRVSMGVAIVGGLIFSTILTLYVIPAIYTYFTSKKSRLSRTTA